MKINASLILPVLLLALTYVILIENAKEKMRNPVRDYREATHATRDSVRDGWLDRIRVRALTLDYTTDGPETFRYFPGEADPGKTRGVVIRIYDPEVLTDRTAAEDIVVFSGNRAGRCSIIRHPVPYGTRIEILIRHGGNRHHAGKKNMTI